MLNRKESSIDPCRDLYSFDFLISHNDHDVDVISIVETQEKPQLYQRSVQLFKEPAVETKIDIIAVPPGLCVWDVLHDANTSYQPVSMIIATHATPITERAIELQQRIQQEFTPEEIAQHYLGAAEEFLNRTAWGKSFPSRLRTPEMSRIKKLIPLHRAARDLLPRAVYMLKTGEYPAELSDEELWSAGETLDCSKEICRLFYDKTAQDETLVKVHDEVESVLRGWFKEEYHELFLENLVQKMKVRLPSEKDD